MTAIVVSIIGCKSQVSITLCSAVEEPVDFVVRFTRAEPKEVSGALSPGGRATGNAEPRGDGDYTIELRRASTVKQQPGLYFTSDGGNDDLTVTEDLSLAAGCHPSDSTPASK